MKPEEQPLPPQVFHAEVSRVFTPSAPIDEQALFAGRREQVHEIVDAVNQRGQHVIVFGERGVGKTSLANVLASFLNLPSVLSAKVTCNAGDTFHSLWAKVFQKVSISSSSTSVGFAPKESSTAMPYTAAMPEKITPEAVRHHLHLLSNQMVPILIIDEFDRLSASVKRDIADTVKVLSDEAVKATIVLVGVADSVGDLIEEHESVSRALVQVLMPRMSQEEIREIVTKGLKTLRLTISEDAANRVVLLSQGLPHYTYLLCLHAARDAYDDGTYHLDMDCVNGAVGKALQKAQQTTKTLYVDATSSSRPGNLFTEVLLACSVAKADDLGFFFASDVRTPLQKITGKGYDIPSFAQHLNEFCDSKRGPVLEKKGERRRFRFRFKDPLMQPYVLMQGLASHKLPPEMLVQSED